MVTKVMLEKIISALQKIGISKQEVSSIYLFGSQYWGYATSESDIDLYVILKDNLGINQQDVGQISFRYISTVDETIEAVGKGSWARFYVLMYASRLLYGEKIQLPNYPKEKIIDYLKEKRADVEKIPSSLLKWGYITLMARVFFINYLINFSNTYDLDSFKNCPVIDKDEKNLIDSLHQKLFSHVEASNTEKENIITLINKLDKYIISKVKAT